MRSGTSPPPASPAGTWGSTSASLCCQRTASTSSCPWETMTARAARLVEAAVASGLNIPVSSGTHAGNPAIHKTPRLANGTVKLPGLGGRSPGTGDTADVAEATESDPMDPDRVRRDLAELDAATFTSLHVLDRVPAIFESHMQYASWRSQIGAGLEVDPLNIVVVGSMSLGVSLSPKEDKFLKPVHSLSDVDIAVISPRHFDESWRALRALGPVDKLRATSKEAAELLAWHRRTLIFDGTIATDRILSYLPFGPAWAGVLGRAGRMAPTQDRDVK